MEICVCVCGVALGQVWSCYDHMGTIRLFLQTGSPVFGVLVIGAIPFGFTLGAPDCLKPFFPAYVYAYVFIQIRVYVYIYVIYIYLYACYPHASMSSCHYE